MSVGSEEAHEITLALASLRLFSPFMWCQAGKVLISLRTEPARRHIRLSYSERKKFINCGSSRQLLLVSSPPTSHIAKALAFISHLLVGHGRHFFASLFRMPSDHRMDTETCDGIATRFKKTRFAGDRFVIRRASVSTVVRHSGH